MHARPSPDEGAAESPRDAGKHVKAATDLAETLMRRAQALETRSERLARQRFGHMLSSGQGITFTTKLLDRSLRPRDPRKVALAVSELVDGPLDFLRPAERFLLRTFAHVWRLAPPTAVNVLIRHLRAEAGRYVRSAEDRELHSYLERRRRDGVTVNLNVVGEAVLGKAEAEARLERYETALRDPAVQAIAVKISSVAAKVHPLAYEPSVDEVSTALRRLFRAAGAKIVTLDMESYEDLEPTVAAFSRVLMEDEFLDRTHGIALQAYLPDSYAALRLVTAIAAERIGRHGAPLRVRLVKGANLAMERLTARLNNWEQAPYTSKAEVDANMKRMLLWALTPDHARNVRVGIGSHNVFDIAFAICTARAEGTLDALTIEMLEGMAEPLRRAVVEVAPRQLVYAPAATHDEFLAAMAYLVRRLDENTSAENFLRHAFTMQPGDAAWAEQQSRFEESCALAATVSTRPRRGTPRRDGRVHPSGQFHNEPNTDWARTENRNRVRGAIRATRLEPVPAPVSRVDIDARVQAAAADPTGWAERPLGERASILVDAAERLRERRDELIGLMAAETKKTCLESDPEVSEAIDFLSYYARSLDDLVGDPRVDVTPRGAAAVFSPWNFPLAIPTGGVAAALVGGNRVILKPSPYSVRVAAAGMTALWDAGVPTDVLQLVHCDVPGAAHLAAHPDLDALVFTGSTRTARQIISARPDLCLIAETGGKNATIVTATADRDLAITHILQSAFGHAGQKCSATSLVVAEADVFDDPAFRERLEDAVSALRCGPATDLATDVPPLVTPPNSALRRVLDETLVDAPLDGTVPPTVLWGVKEGSAAHMQELFGPVLSVMRAQDLPDAVRIVNATGYGLTAGLESLREADWVLWANHVHAGNLYVNRPTTGAVVQRQPFGGWGLSGFGPGAKAGGPNYATQLCRITASAGMTASSVSYDASVIASAHDPQQIPGQANLFRYVPARNVVIRIERGDHPAVVDRRREAAHTVGCDARLSTFETESVEELAGRLEHVHRVIRCGPATDPQLLAAAARAWTWLCANPLTYTERDLLPFVVEQTVSVDYHRYGWVPPGSGPAGWMRELSGG